MLEVLEELEALGWSREYLGLRQLALQVQVLLELRLV